MKKIFLLAVVIFIVNISFAQFDANTMFNDTLKPFGDGGDGFASVIEDSNSYYALSFINSTLGQYPYMIELDNKGNLVKKRIYIDTNNNYAIYPKTQLQWRQSVVQELRL